MARARADLKNQSEKSCSLPILNVIRLNVKKSNKLAPTVSIEAVYSKRRGEPMNKILLLAFAAACLFAAIQSPAKAAPYAAVVMDARTGEVLHSRSADRQLHPASLTKMMTLYIAFEAIERGEIGLDDRVRISQNAFREPPSKLGMREGQRISLRYLLRAAALKSANDAATAIGEAISGSEAAFTRRMTETARRMGMRNTTFRNAHGLTQTGHLSTARDMAILSRHIIYDYPEYYNLFGATSRHVGSTTVRNTNRRLLQYYRGADGIKTGFTNAAGYNLSASARRGNERIVAVVFGGQSSDWRYRRMVELLNMGFERAPTNAALVRPQMLEFGAVRTAARPARRDSAGSTQIASAARFVGQAFVSPANASTQSSPPVQFTSASRSAPGFAERPMARGAGQWAIQLGAYNARRSAEQILQNTRGFAIPPLRNGLVRVDATQVRGVDLYEAKVVGLTAMQAATACAALQERNRICRLVDPSEG
jgi:D-alanyl-D-alanine carboxypeptidase